MLLDVSIIVMKFPKKIDYYYVWITKTCLSNTNFAIILNYIYVEI